MKRFKFLALAIIPMLISGCGSGGETTQSTSTPESTSSGEVPGLVKKNIEVEMVSHFGEVMSESTYKDSGLYSDYWFINDSYTLNYELAVMSGMAAGASYSNSTDKTGTKIAKFLEDAGYSNIVKNQYYADGETLEDSVGGIIGSKKIKNYQGKEYTLLALFPRNAGYEAEWMGNFHMGTSGIHTGFLQARDELLRFMKKYITDKNITGDIKVWSSGYSRGAAVTNLVGGYLAEDSGYFGNTVTLNPHDVYVYTIGTPNVVTNGLSKASVLSVSAARGEGYHDTEGALYTYTGVGNIDLTAENYKGIHNFVATGDYITKLPPADYSFTRYGTTETITYGGEAFVTKLAALSEETAELFADGQTYSTEIPYKTIDIQTIDIVDSEDKISPDAFLNSLVAGIVKVATDREALVRLGYADILGDITAIYGVDGPAVLAKLVQQGTTSLVGAGALAYLTSVLNALGSETDAKGLAEIVMQVVEMMGKTITDHATYTDQAFLKDVLDFLINDYQTDEKAKARVTKLTALIPAPYDALLTSVLEYAKTKQIKVATVDDVLSLVANYVYEHKTDKVVDDLLTALVKLIPENYRSYLTYVTFITGKTHDDITDPNEKNKAIVLDVIEACAIGILDSDGVTVKTSAPEFRFAMMNLVISFTLSSSEKLVNLITNGATSGSGPVVRDAVPLYEIVEEVLALALPKDSEGKVPTIKALTAETLKALLAKVKTTKSATYFDDLGNKVDSVINLASAFLFNRGEKFVLKDDIQKALTAYKMVQLVFPAHDHELYISYLQTKLPA